VGAGLPIVSALLRAGAGVNAVQQCAERSSAMKHVQDPQIQPHVWNGCTAITIAKFKSKTQLLTMLLANGGDSDVGSEPAFYRAAMLMQAMRLIGLSNGSLNGLVGVIEGSFNKTTLRFVVVLNDKGDRKGE